jgi:hypothetical protein
MNADVILPTPDESAGFQSGHPDGKILHLNEDDNDFILELLNVVIDRLSALEIVVQRIDDRLEQQLLYAQGKRSVGNESSPSNPLNPPI